MKEPQAKAAVGPAGWVQDQLYQIKGEVAQLEQQLGHLQSMTSELTESLHSLEASLRAAASGAGQVPRLQDEINQAAALIAQLQDQQAATREQIEALGRRREDEQDRGQQDWVEAVRRIEQLERQVEGWVDRQAGVDEVGRRFQEEISLVRQQLQDMDHRLDAAESKAGRGLEGANRAEHTLTQVEATILALQREDETIAERAKVGIEAARRLEGSLGDHLKQLERLELLAERIELHRAERQRLEDRALRLEEELGELRGREEEQEHQQGQLRGQQQGLASRLDALQEAVDGHRAQVAEQLRRLTESQARTKRREIQELEREIREMKEYVAGLSDQ